MRTLVTYFDSDSLNEVEGTDFPDQVSMTCDERGMRSCDPHRSGTWQQTYTGYYWILLKCRRPMRLLVALIIITLNHFFVLTGSRCTDGSHVQNIKGVSVY